VTRVIAIADGGLRIGQKAVPGPFRVALVIFIVIALSLPYLPPRCALGALRAQRVVWDLRVA
jgi:hypothetical protein